MSELSSSDRRVLRRHILEDAPELLENMCHDYNASLNQVIVAFMMAAEKQGGYPAARFMHTTTLYMVGELVCQLGE